MGNGSSSSPNQSKYVAVDRKNRDDHIRRILLLGTCGSGKLTLFKQIRIIHGEGFSPKDRFAFVDHIRAQIREQMQLAIECVEELAKKEMGDDFKETDDWNPFDQLSDETQDAIQILRRRPQSNWNDELVAACKTLWNEEAIKDIYDRRAIMQIEDTSAYFWDKLDEINTPHYCPSTRDILFVRHRTTGVIEHKFTFKNIRYYMLDVGGQKSERKKWINCFENVSAVVFLASLSAYDEVMFEDENVNSMDDAIQLFGEIVKNQLMEKTKIFLVLNKMDLFDQKLQRKSLACGGRFANGYDEDICYNECKDSDELFDKNFEYIIDRFVETIKTEKKGDVYILDMCATDQDNVEEQFNEIVRILADEDELMIEEKSPGPEIFVDTMNASPHTVEMNPKQFISRPRSLDRTNRMQIRSVEHSDESDEKEDGTISNGEKALRTIGTLVYVLVMMVYRFHITLLSPFLVCCSCCRQRIKSSSWLFEKIPIEDSIYGTSILLTTFLVLLAIFLLDIYSEIQSWMIAYMAWCIYVVMYSFNRACTVYSIFSKREICGMKARNVQGLNLIIKYVVGVEVENKAVNNYTRLLAVVGGLFPALLAGLIANYILQEKYTLKCSKDFSSEICEGPICCKLISSHEIKYFYQFIGVLASRIIASFGIVRLIGWLFCKGHPELRKMHKINQYYNCNQSCFAS
eukprot:422916_1